MRIPGPMPRIGRAIGAEANRVSRRPRDMRKAAIGFHALLGLALVLVGLQGLARAEAPADLKRFSGTYQLAGTREAGQAVVDKAFDAALAKMSMVMRLMAKRALNKGFVERIVIELPGDKISVKLGENEAVPTAPGKAEKVERDGRSGMLTQRLSGKKLEILLENDDGSIRNVLELSADGKTLVRDVTVTSKRLGQPVHYKLSYARK